MNRSYSQYLNRLEAERPRLFTPGTNQDVVPLKPKQPWDGQKNSELRGLFYVEQKPDATRANQVARAALHATTVEEQRTEDKTIKHRTNPHE